MLCNLPLNSANFPQVCAVNLAVFTSISQHTAPFHGNIIMSAPLSVCQIMKLSTSKITAPKKSACFNCCIISYLVIVVVVILITFDSFHILYFFIHFHINFHDSITKYNTSFKKSQNYINFSMPNAVISISHAQFSFSKLFC